MDRIIEVLINFHNEDPEAMEDLSKTNRAKAMIETIEAEASNLKNDSWDLGDLLVNILKTLSREDLKAINESLIIR